MIAWVFVPSAGLGLIKPELLKLLPQAQTTNLQTVALLHLRSKARRGYSRNRRRTWSVQRRAELLIRCVISEKKRSRGCPGFC